jgi:imidazole glycerol phosphate synthase subunit HisF
VGGGIRSRGRRRAVEGRGRQGEPQHRGAEDPSLITTLARRYGSQAVIVAIDAKRRGDHFAVFVRSGTSDADRDAVEWARQAEGVRRRRDPADVDGPRRHARRLRQRDDRGRVGRGEHPGHRLGGAGTFDHFTDVFTEGHADAALAASIFHYAESSVTDLKRHLRQQGIPVPSLMLIPSIDLQNGAVVQLVQGEKLAIRAEDAEPWIQKFSRFPRVQLIDLDAAMGKGDNAAIVSSICGRLPCRVGGGIRSVERARRCSAPARTP